MKLHSNRYPTTIITISAAVIDTTSWRWSSAAFA